MPEEIRRAFDLETWRVLATAVIGASGTLAFIHIALSIAVASLTCVWLVLKIRRAIRGRDEE